MEKLGRNSYSCGSFFVGNCNCEQVPENVKNIGLIKTHLEYLRPNRTKKTNLFPEDSASTHCSTSDRDSAKLTLIQMRAATTRRKLRSFSHPAINFIFTSENLKEPEISPLGLKISNKLHKTLGLNQPEKEPSRESAVQNTQIEEYKRKSIDKAQQYFAESGILGPNNLGNSRDLIKKTSRIHIDQGIKSKIRKTSLCLLSRTIGEKCEKNTTLSTAPKLTQTLTSTPKIPLKDSEELIVKNIQAQVYILKDIIETGETKIIMLRAEVNKVKRVLQELMYSNSHNKMKLPSENPNVCVFCQEEPELSQVFLPPHPILL